ncbi:beta-defensin 129 [Lemur catta]|uniref:beta-defensin 129 n=1 Tax=Lemur catta TaxID=9447 RepID=UPI001E266AD8|nr:beta-defensin 129 [Lemur catta]XP_045385468.1 beta-defensin 129 [Lemur catta]XP_045385469.1 beta-defensin 129 [Lemur catta]XP_045385470.1 beta-defensin 129 [Lemur catta]
MKLLFPVFASLMLQYQVNTEYFGLKMCLKGFGRCKDHCNVDEKQVQKCKKKKCCIGPKVVQLIKNYLQHEIPHILGEDTQEMLNATKNSSAVIQTKHILSGVLPKINNFTPFANINSIIIPNAISVNSDTTSTRTPGRNTYTATSTKKDTKKSKDSAVLPPPAPPPP